MWLSYLVQSYYVRHQSTKTWNLCFCGSTSYCRGFHVPSYNKLVILLHLFQANYIIGDLISEINYLYRNIKSLFKIPYHEGHQWKYMLAFDSWRLEASSARTDSQGHAPCLTGCILTPSVQRLHWRCLLRKGCKYLFSSLIWEFGSFVHGSCWELNGVFFLCLFMISSYVSCLGESCTALASTYEVMFGFSVWESSEMSQQSEQLIRL